jgi:hypothetical protein
MEDLRRQYGDNLLAKLEHELQKEKSSVWLAKIDSDFMEKVVTIRPGYLTKAEIETRIEIIALRLNKIFTRYLCQ